MSFKPIICVDFDGVIHSYKSGWKGVDVIADEPVPEAFDWLSDLIEQHNSGADSAPWPVIYSSRSKSPEGIKAMKEWFAIHGFPAEYLAVLEFPTQKPPAYLTIDDRAICFQGVFPSASEMLNFKPWNK